MPGKIICLTCKKIISKFDKDNEVVKFDIVGHEFVTISNDNFIEGL